MPRLFSTGIFFCLLWAQLSFAAPAAEESASAVVKKLTDALVVAMQEAETTDYEARYDQLKPVVEDTHALASIAKYSVGESWDSLTEDQRNQLIEKFAEYSTSAYAGSFDEYSGEAFEIVSEQPMRRKRVLVKALLNRPQKDSITFDYVLSNASGRWLILNVIYDGVSDLALKRAQYTSVIEREGFEALLKKLSNKIEMYAGNQVPEEEEESDGILDRITEKFSLPSLPDIGWIGGGDDEDEKTEATDDGQVKDEIVDDGAS